MKFSQKDSLWELGFWGARLQQGRQAAGAPLFFGKIAKLQLVVLDCICLQLDCNLIVELVARSAASSQMDAKGPRGGRRIARSVASDQNGTMHSGGR